MEKSGFLARWRVSTKHFLWVSLQILLTILLTLNTRAVALALPSEATLDFFDLNGIYYYDPTGRDSNCVMNTTGNNLTIIGDSITNGARADITALLPDAKIYAQDSKQFGSGSDSAISPSDTDVNPSGISIVKYLLAEGSLGNTVVFALGTNNSGLRQSQVNDLLDLLGTTRFVYFLTNFSSTEPNKYDSNNEIFMTAAENANVSVIDWAAEVRDNPSQYIAEDSYHVHPNALGKKLFAELIDKAVGGSTSMTAGSNGNYTNYAGDKLITDTEIGLMESNIPIYQQAINETGAASYGVTWQILAVLHYKENSFGRSNPRQTLKACPHGGSQGAWQTASLGCIYEVKDFLTEAEFLEETITTIEQIIIPKIKGNINKDLFTADGVMEFFYSYNGKGYKQKGLDMGYTEYEAKIGAGSVYVMNRYDAPRDPQYPETMNPIWAGRYTDDGVYEEGSVSYRAGAYTLYVAMGGATFCSNIGIASGGLNKDQALALMNDYIENVRCSDWSTICGFGNAADGGKANCVTFTQYFINRFTSAGLIVGPGNGGWVVSNLTGTDVDTKFGWYYHEHDNSSKGFQYGGFEPRPFAVFSSGLSNAECPRGSGIKCGHTGIILGVDQANNKIYIGQAGLNSPLRGYSDVVEKDLDSYTNGNYWYAYMDSIINLEAISEVIGGMM